VDDLASYLFLTDVFARMSGGAELAAAVNSAAQALRATTAEEAHRRLGEIAEADDAPELEARLAVTRTWLRDLGADGRPFAAPTDWAAYQLYCGAIVPPA
jgi:hypothetical protein